MRKSTFAAIAAAVAYAQPASAELSLYGSLSMSWQQVDSSQAAGDRNAASNEQGMRFGSQVQDGQSADNNGSYFGVKGVLGTLSFVFETGADTDSRNGAAHGLASTRAAFIQYSGAVGSVRFGRITSAYASIMKRIDPFYDTSAANFIGGFSPEGASYGMSNLANGWTSDSLEYGTPYWNGLSLVTGIYTQELNDEDHDYYIGLAIKNGPFDLLLGQLQIGAGNADGVVAGSGSVVDTSSHLALGLNWEAIAIGLSYELIALRNVNDKRQYSQVSFRAFPNAPMGIDVAGGLVDQGAGEGIGGSIGIRGTIGALSKWRLIYSFADLANDSRNETLSLQFRVSFDATVAQLSDASSTPLKPDGEAELP